MEKRKFLSILGVSVLIVGMLFFATGCIFYKIQLVKAEKTVEAQQVNEKILSFTKLFVSKIFRGGAEVSFEDRLSLENSVRSLNNQAIFEQWTKFVNSKDAADSQKQAVSLFNLLLSSITY